ncbi:MAG: DUF4838 domain-containing protein [Clostridia bacterium]|nr:DUF4838 domain-containing protein [Clostridia bacterium]
MKVKKIISTLLALSLGATVFASCGKSGGDGSDSSKEQTPSQNYDWMKYDDASVISDFDPHFAEGTLHDVNIDYDDPAGAFIVDKKTDYKIVVGDGTATQASSFINKMIIQATGISLVKIDEIEATVTADSTYVLLGCDDTFNEKGFEKPSYDKIGIAGYAIKTYGKNVFIEAYTQNGYQMAALAFLRAVLGYDMFAGDLIIFERDGKILPKMDIVERPDYDYRQQVNNVDGETAYGLGFTTTTMFINTGSGWVHNVCDYTLKSDREEHPGWYSDDPAKAQSCFTAHGNKEEYALMVNRFAERLIYFINNNSKDINNILISQMDVALGNTVSRCHCDTCEASYGFYNSIAGAMLMLINDVAKIVDEYLDSEQAIEDGFEPDHELNIIMLVYGDAINAPSKIENGNYVFDENGKGVPEVERRFWLDENGEVYYEDGKTESGEDKLLVCGERVGLMYAAAAASYIYSFYDPVNLVYKNRVDAWSGLGGSFYFWLYEISYYQYLYPYNSFDSYAENMRYFKDHGGKYMYSEGTWENPNNPGFAKLRDYLASKLEFDVNNDYNTLVDRYFNYYFDDAKDYMRQFFEEVVANLRHYESEIGGGVHNYNVSKKEYWEEGKLRSWLALCDKAYAAIEHYKVDDPEKYEALKKHILCETLFPRYVLCNDYADSFSNDTIVEMRREFMNDFYALQNTSHQEHFTIDAVFSSWNLI